MTMEAKELGFVPARGALGAAMLYHGASKLRGEGPRQTGEMFESLGIRPGQAWAKATGVAEVLAGASLILGIGTRLGALAVLATQAVAVAKVHAPKGFSNMAGGFEYNLLIMAAAAGILLAGPGTLSAHELVERRIDGGARRWLSSRRRTGGRLARLLK